MLGGRQKLPDKDLLKIESSSGTAEGTAEGTADGAASLFDNVESDIESEINKLVKRKETKTLGSDTKNETQKPFSVTSEMLLNAYPNNLFYSNGDKHYETPILTSPSSMKEGQLSNSNFESLFNEIKTNNKDNTDIANITLEQCLTQYNSIIDNPEKHSDIHYLINLFLLLQNDVSCFNISNSFVNVKEDDKIMTGGMDEQREGPFPLQREDPDPQPYDQLFEIEDREEEIIQLGPGNNLLVYLIPSTVVFIGLCALSSLFGMPVEDPMFTGGLIAASIIITTNGGIRMLNLIGNGANDNLIPYVQGNRLIDTGIRGLRRIVNITLIQPNIERLVGNGIIRPMALLNPNIRLQRLIINNNQFDDDLRQRLRLLDEERVQRAIRDGHVADAIRAGDNPQLNALDARENERLVAYAAGIQPELDNLRQQVAGAEQQRREEYTKPVFKLQSQEIIQDFLKTKQTELGILIPHFSEKQDKTQLQQFTPLPPTLFDKLRQQWRQYFNGWKEPPDSWGDGDNTEKRNRKKGELNGIPFFIRNVQFEGIYKEQLKDVQNSYLAILTQKTSSPKCYGIHATPP